MPVVRGRRPLRYLQPRESEPRLVLHDAGEREVKLRSLLRDPFSPHSTTITLDNALAYGQAQARARVFVFVESLKQPKNAFGVRLLKADALVAHTDDAFLTVDLGRNVNFGRSILLSILERV